MYDLLKGLRVVEVSAFVAGPTCQLDTLATGKRDALWRDDRGAHEAAH